MDDPKTSQSLFGPRVRIAPSPTGYLHIGTARTALFNFLFARKHGGQFILRIEDTDPKRSKKEYEENIYEGLKWLGIMWDEGPDIGGDYGPYRQSERVDIYEKYLRQLLDENKAYYCFCTPEELEAQRRDMISRGLPPKYSGKCRHLPPETVKQYLAQGKHSVIRFKMPPKEVKFHDLIRGEIKVDLNLIGDIVIARNLREPLYNFSVVIDDYLMKITHIIRGEDHISNTPKQIAIQEALGLPRPIYAHLPMILGPDRSKLSKRHGAMPVTEYRKMGYLPEAIVNFIALLGWHPASDREIFNMEELIKEFSLKRVQKSGAVFNVNKLNWFNSQYLRHLSLDELTKIVREYLQKYSDKAELLKEYSDEYLKKVIEIELTRINKLSDLIVLSDFFFEKNLRYSPDLLVWRDMTLAEVKQSLQDSAKVLQQINQKDFLRSNIQVKLFEFIEKSPQYRGDKGRLLWPLRVALSGKKASPSPFEIAEILGKKETLRRIEVALKKI